VQAVAFPRKNPPPRRGQSEDKTPTSYDMKAQAALDLQQLQQKFTSLAQAIPQEKIQLAPRRGIRARLQRCFCIQRGRDLFSKIAGCRYAAGFDGKGFDKTTTDKAKIIEWLNKSFAHSIAAANA